MAFVVGVGVEGLSTTKRKMRKLPDDIKDGIVLVSGRIARVVGDEASRRFVALGRQGPLVARTVRSAKGSVPTIKVGGSSKLGKNKKPAYKLLYGTEFGSNKYPQFHAAHTGQTGRALYPAIRDKTEYMVHEWTKATDRALEAFADYDSLYDTEELV